MAIVKLGEVLLGLRGTIGGITFSANGSSAYAKAWRRPVDRRTASQSGKRGWFSRIRGDWAECTVEQVAAWDALALDPPEEDYNSLDDRVYLSGSAWHTRVNMRRLEAGQEIERDAPASVAVVAPDSFGLEVYDYADEVSDDVFSYTEGDFDGFYAALHLSASLSGVRNVQTSGYYVVWCAAVEGATETRINEELAVAFPWLSAGQKVFGRLRKQSVTGIRSAALLATAVVQEVA